MLFRSRAMKTVYDMTRTRLASLGLAAALIAFPAPACADALADLLNSPQMSKFQAHDGGDDLFSSRYLPEGSNFASVFIMHDGHDLLHKWIAPLETDFTPSPIIGNKAAEYIEGIRIYSSDKANDIRVRILVPHPKFVPMLKYGLIKAFSEIQPPQLEFQNQESIFIRGDKARLFTHKEGSCSLLMELTKSTLLQLFQQECSGLHTLVTLAELLDIRRLERKLDS